MPLAIFDLDDTLIDGDCASLWNEQMARLGWVDRDSFMQRDAQFFQAYNQGELDMAQYMAFTLEPLLGRTEEEVAHLVEPWVEDVIEPLIFSDATRCIAAHRAAGDRVLIISASGMHLVQPIAARIGIDEVLAVELDVAHGAYNGHPRGVLTYQEGKVTRLMEWLQAEGETLDGAAFYSDSRNDLPLLKQVAHPNAVNPDPALRAHAEQAGWPILSWR